MDGSDSDHRRTRQVERLLEGGQVDSAELAYDLEAWHLGVVAQGRHATEALRDLALKLDQRLLLVCREGGTVWAWCGSRRNVDADRVQRILGSSLPPRTMLAIGEPSMGLSGFRLSHRQATAALLIAQERSQSLVRYREVVLEAAMRQNELFAMSLRELYLAPLERLSIDGATVRKTLQAYFAADHQISSAASALGVSRPTVRHRIRAIEAELDRPLTTVAAEMKAALRLHALDSG